MAKWFRTGKEGVTESQKVDATRKARSSDKGPIPFTLDYNTNARAIMVDDPLFFLYVHTIKIGPKNYVRLTCIRDVETCPACETGDNPAYAVSGTVIDTRPFTRNNGEKVRFSKKPIIAKGKAREILLRRMEENGGKLRGMVMKFARGSTQTESNVGEDIQILATITKEQLEKTRPSDVELKEWFSPLDYKEIFKPKTAKEMAEILGVDPPLGSGEDDDLFGDVKPKTPGTAKDDDIFGDSPSESGASESADSIFGDDSSASSGTPDSTLDDDASIDDLLEN